MLYRFRQILQELNLGWGYGDVAMTILIFALEVIQKTLLRKGYFVFGIVFFISAWTISM